MSTSRFTLVRQSLIEQVFGAQGWTYFWEARFLPRWLPLLLGAGLGILSASLIIDGVWYLLLPLVLAVPLAMLLIRYPFAAVIIWILFTPYFVVTPTMVERTIFWGLHRALIPATLIIVILRDWMGLKKKKPIQFGWAEGAMILFLLSTVVNILLISDSNRAFIRLYDRIIPPFCIYWLVRLLAPTHKELKSFLPAALITLLGECTIGLLSWFAPQAVPPKWLGLEGERTVGSLSNVAVYTTTLIFLAILLFQYAMNCKSRWQRPLLVLSFGLAYFCVFFSFSRGSWLGGSLVLIGLLFMYPRVVLQVTVAVVITTLVLGSSILASEVSWAIERLNDEDTANGRIVGNTASLRMIAEKPVFGWGYDNYDLYNIRFKTRVGSIALDVHGTSHNTYLTIMAEQGLPTFLLYLFPVGWWLVLSFKVWGRMPKRGFISRSLLLLLWLVLLHEFVVSSFMDMIRFNLFGTTIWWLVLGLIASIVHSYLKRPMLEPQPTTPSYSFSG